MRSRCTAAGCLVVLIALLFAGCERAPTQDTHTQTSTPSAHGAPESTAPGKLDAAQLLQILTTPDADPQALLDAIHTARDDKIKAAIPALERLLEDARPGIVVAAAAALAGLNAPDTDLKLIEAAGRLSRARRLESLRQLLYILGDLGGPRVVTYLQAVAEGHESPAIQQAAAQILQNIENRPSF